MNEKVFKYSVWGILALFMSVCAYFITLNAGWLIGDDDIVLIHTGMGHFYNPAYNIWPSEGRCFPMAYYMYNVLPLFIDGYIDALPHYILHAIVYCLMLIVSMLLFSDVCKDEKPWIRFGIPLLLTIFIGARTFQTFIYCWSTLWFECFMTMLMCASYYLFHTHSKWWAVACVLISVYLTWMLESAFVVPLVMGVCGLVLRRKESREECWLSMALVLVALTYLIYYFFAVFLHIEGDTYDPAHGSGVTFIDNIVKILMSQKFLWLAIVLLGVRVWEVLCRKDKVSFYDILLLAAAGYCLGGWILKLNWVLYYHRVVILSSLPVAYYANHYLKGKWTLSIMLIYAIFYVAKMPSQIEGCQMWRLDSEKYISGLEQVGHIGEEIYWYAPNVEQGSLEDKQNTWLHESEQNTLRYVMQNEDIEISILDSYHGEVGYLIIQDDLLQDIMFPVAEPLVTDHHYGISIYKLNNNYSNEYTF